MNDADPPNDTRMENNNHGADNLERKSSPKSSSADYSHVPHKAVNEDFPSSSLYPEVAIMIDGPMGSMDNSTKNLEDVYVERINKNKTNIVSAADQSPASSDDESLTIDGKEKKKILLKQ